jgi:hypothetical protein
VSTGNQTERHCRRCGGVQIGSVLRVVRPRPCRRSAAVTRPLESFGQIAMRRACATRCLATCLSTSSDPCARTQIDRQGSARRGIFRACGRRAVRSPLSDGGRQGTRPRRRCGVDGAALHAPRRGDRQEVWSAADRTVVQAMIEYSARVFCRLPDSPPPSPNPAPTHPQPHADSSTRTQCGRRASARRGPADGVSPARPTWRKANHDAAATSSAQPSACAAARGSARCGGTLA